MSALAFSTGFAYSTNERSSATVAMLQRTIAAITQPSHGWKSTRRIASQIPKLIVPTRPTMVAPVATIATRLRLSVASGVSADAQRDDDDPGHHERADERRGEQQVNREDPVLEGHALGAICSTT